jgi:hypothetical protein
MVLGFIISNFVIKLLISFNSDSNDEGLTLNDTHWLWFQSFNLSRISGSIYFTRLLKAMFIIYINFPKMIDVCKRISQKISDDNFYAVIKRWKVDVYYY